MVKFNRKPIEYIANKIHHQRLDVLMVTRGFANSRNRARDLITAGSVVVNGIVVQKSGKLLSENCLIEVKAFDNPWVSRAGLKLAGALEVFSDLNVAGCKALDIGASKGGFTEVLLAHGASHVVAVDVGEGQLQNHLVVDRRVTVLDNTNARYLTSSMLPYPPDFIVCDASFISLKKILPASLELAAAGAKLVALVKPQFEVGKGLVGKGGIVRDPNLQQKVVSGISNWLVNNMSWVVINTVPSKIAGADGNAEFLLLAKKVE